MGDALLRPEPFSLHSLADCLADFGERTFVALHLSPHSKLSCISLDTGSPLLVKPASWSPQNLSAFSVNSAKQVIERGYEYHSPCGVFPSITGWQSLRLVCISVRLSNHFRPKN